MRLQIATKAAAPSIRIGFTDQRLTAHGGLSVWSHFLRQKRFRQRIPLSVLRHFKVMQSASQQCILSSGLQHT